MFKLFDMPWDLSTTLIQAAFHRQAGMITNIPKVVICRSVEANSYHRCD